MRTGVEGSMWMDFTEEERGKNAHRLRIRENADIWKLAQKIGINRVLVTEIA